MRHGFPRRWEYAAHGLVWYVIGLEPNQEPLVWNPTWIEQHGQPPTNVSGLTQAGVDIWPDIRIKSSQSSFWACLDTNVPHTAWFISFNARQILWIWISVVLWSFMCNMASVKFYIISTRNLKWTFRLKALLKCNIIINERLYHCGLCVNVILPKYYFLFVFRGTLQCAIIQNVYFNNRVHNVLYVWHLITTTTTTTITTLFVW